MTDQDGGVTSYSYDSAGRMLSFTTPNGNVHVTNQYDSNNRVTEQTLPDGGIYNFAYELGSGGNVAATTMIDPRGSSCSMAFNSNGYITSDIWAMTRPEQVEDTYNRDPNTNLLNSVTDTLGRTTAYTYDSLGNTTSITSLAGTSSAATTSMTYDPNFGQLTSVTDPLGHTWAMTLDSKGNVIGNADPLGHQTVLTYNSSGQSQPLPTHWAIPPALLIPTAFSPPLPIRSATPEISSRTTPGGSWNPWTRWAIRPTTATTAWMI